MEVSFYKNPEIIVLDKGRNSFANTVLRIKFTYFNLLKLSGVFLRATRFNIQQFYMVLSLR